MKITFTQGKFNKIHISVDGEYMFTVDAEYWYSCPYCRLKEITDENECDRFYSDIGSRYAFISGLRVLSYGDHSRKELKQKLTTKGHKAEYVELALDKLEEYGYINDKRFSKDTADRLIRTKHMSRGGIKSVLLRKGVDNEIVSEVISELEVDPTAEITALLDKKYRRYLGDENGEKKIVAALQRLGYSWAEIKSAVNAYNSDREEISDD